MGRRVSPTASWVSDITSGLMADDREELQRIAQLVEANRERMQAIEQQVRQLESIRIEQMQAIEALLAIPDEGAEGAMIPLGSGVQIVADIPAEGAQKFNESIEGMEPEEITEEPAPSAPAPRRAKRKRGTDLTLDD